MGRPYAASEAKRPARGLRPPPKLRAGSTDENTLPATPLAPSRSNRPRARLDDDDPRRSSRSGCEPFQQASPALRRDGPATANDQVRVLASASLDLTPITPGRSRTSSTNATARSCEPHLSPQSLDASPPTYIRAPNGVRAPNGKNGEKNSLRVSAGPLKGPSCGRPRMANRNGRTRPPAMHGPGLRLAPAGRAAVRMTAPPRDQCLA